MSIQSVNSTASGGVIALRQSSPGNTSTAQETQLANKAATVTQLAAQPTKDVQASRQQLDEAVKAVDDFVKSVNSSLQFSVDDDTGITVVKVIDSATKEVVRQIPSEEMLSIAKALDSIKGLLVHQKA